MGCGCESCKRSYRDSHEVNFPEPVYVINTFSRINLTKVTSEFDGQSSAIQIRFSPAIFKEDFHSHWSDERGEHYTNTYNQRKAEVVKVETVREYEAASTSNSRCEQYLAVHSNDCRLKCPNSSCVDYNTTRTLQTTCQTAKCLNRGKGHQWVCQYPVGGETKSQYNGQCHSWAASTKCATNATVCILGLLTQAFVGVGISTASTGTILIAAVA